MNHYPEPTWGYIGLHYMYKSYHFIKSQFSKIKFISLVKAFISLAKNGKGSLISLTDVWFTNLIDGHHSLRACNNAICFCCVWKKTVTYSKQWTSHSSKSSETVILSITKSVPYDGNPAAEVWWTNTSSLSSRDSSQRCNLNSINFTCSCLV